MSKVYVLDGNPVAWQRANPDYNNRRMWDNQRALKFLYARTMEDQRGKDPMYEGPLLLEVNFFFHMPQNKKKIFESLRGSHHHIKPDLSNLIKLIEDAAKGILYHDDALIASINANKYYADRPRTEFSIVQLPNPANKLSIVQI